MSEGTDELAVEQALREHGLEVAPEDRQALVELRPLFRLMVERLRAPAVRDVAPATVFRPLEGRGGRRSGG